MELNPHDRCKKCGMCQFVTGKKPILRYEDGYWRIECPICGRGTKWCKTKDKAVILYKQ